MKRFYYRGSRLAYDLTNTFSWEPYKSMKVKDVILDPDSITIEYPEHGITAFTFNGDTRNESEMKTERCTRKPDGCCFEHSGCGDELCAEHYPLQEVTIKCDKEALINQTIVGFELVPQQEYSSYYHEFDFILESGVRVKLQIGNNTPEHDLTLDLAADY